MSFRVIQPMTWAGMQKGGPDSPMVCGACPDWEACAKRGACDRATAADYVPPVLRPRCTCPCGRGTNPSCPVCP